MKTRIALGLDLETIAPRLHMIYFEELKAKLEAATGAKHLSTTLRGATAILEFEGLEAFVFTMNAQRYRWVNISWEA